ncbi:gp058 [Rhodococcus phage ReqiDocB7]|uniref:gp058 n=1 Tax=Rhodococcus phage ReqiDocB7 TaxID=691966 RepID=UPI0001CDD853|nr:gp058 [Rhodococcus phage ReqiDocB7]ADD80844.1 gp058 [Rhodococcus phage ReqiDocB7]
MSKKSRPKKPTINDIPDKYVTCRALMHAWKYHTVERPRGGFIQVLVCMRCPTRKAQHILRDGSIKKNVYLYPRDYLIPGLGFLTAEERGQLRLRAMGLL